MPTSRPFTHLARSYRDYTGDSVQYTIGHRRGVDHDQPIPAAASADHELLESTLFAAIGRCGHYTGPDPFGIRAVRWSPDNTLTIRIVDTVVGAYGRTEPYSHIVASQILPYGDTGACWNGVDNLRILAVTEHELTVTLAGTDARLVLRGGYRTDWRQAVAKRRRDITAYHEGARPMWNDPAPEPDESPGYSRMHREMAWLGSGLLRRVGLFRSATNAFQVSGWCCDEQFKFILDISPQAWTDHNSFESALTDPVWGLGLTTHTRWCHCDRTPDQYHMCAVILTHPSSRVGGVQLRFGCTEAPKNFDATAFRPDNLHIHKQWQRRVFPS